MTSKITNKDIRWKQRFDNFTRAFSLLNDALANHDLNKYSDLEKEGIIQRFEYTFELSWKLLKDKMEYDGIIIEQISPRHVIKQAYASKYISDVDIWLKMSGDRNLMSHTYDIKTFNDVTTTIQKNYLPLLNNLHVKFLKEISNTHD